MRLTECQDDVSVACDVSQIKVIHFLVGIVDGDWSCVGRRFVSYS
jgi:hypothetical protein